MQLCERTKLWTLMSGKSFWRTEQRFTCLELDQYFFFKRLMSPTWKMYCFLENRSKSLSFAWRKYWGWSALWGVVGKWVNYHHHHFYLPTCNHWKTNWMIYGWDYPTNETNNCNIFCFTESWLNDEMGSIELAEFSVHRQDRAATSGKASGGGVSILSKTPGARCLILKKSQSIPRLW